MHDLAWIVSVIGMAAILAVFLAVARGASVAAEASAGPPFGRLRGALFWGLVLVVVVVTAVTLGGLPYAAPDRQAAQAITVTATGEQWSWTVSPDTAVVGQPVVFAVSSSDVNHGLGIYDEDLVLLAQTQAMPGYVNRLHHTFTEPGTYRLLCLEYCGLAHHEMAATFTVTAP